MRCKHCGREYVSKGVECTVCHTRGSELKAVLTVVGIYAVLLACGIPYFLNLLHAIAANP